MTVTMEISGYDLSMQLRFLCLYLLNKLMLSYFSGTFLVLAYCLLQNSYKCRVNNASIVDCVINVKRI